MTLRRRLLLTAMTTLLVGMGALILAGSALLDQRVHAEVSDQLRTRSLAQLAALDVSAAGVRVREVPGDAVLDRQAWVLDGSRLIERPGDTSPALDAAAVALARSPRAIEREPPRPGELRLRSEPVRTPDGRRVGTVVVGVSTRPLERLQKEVLVGAVVIAALVALAGVVAIRRALDGALQPVTQMTEAATAWGAQDLDRRFALGPPRDELTALAATLDGLLGRIAAARRHEQRLAAEVAHELRTPLARLRATAELALAGASRGEEQRALRSAIAQADALDRTVTALLAVARQELDPAAGSVDLESVARSVEGVEVVAPAAGLPRAEGEEEVVRRALAPLVDNARRHAVSSVRIALSCDGAQVRAAVEDDGPGVERSLGDAIFDPGVRGPGATPDGAGLGLPLARRLARSCGGDVRLGPGPGGSFVLELPAVQAPVSRGVMGSG